MHTKKHAKKNIDQALKRHKKKEQEVVRSIFINKKKETKSRSQNNNKYGQTVKTAAAQQTSNI